MQTVLVQTVLVQTVLVQTVLVQTVVGQAVIYPAISKDVSARTLEQLKTEGYAVKEQSENGATLEKDGLTRKVTAVAAARVSAPGTGTRHRARAPRPQSWLTAPDHPPLPPPLRRPLPNRPKLLDLYWISTAPPVLPGEADAQTSH
ncbi:hypothetical protein ACFOPQ_10905 [Deinococcus antarcticus]|uniref:PASTA domain-containing protein n=1 Tax=Deinococcus antarcticus TaxID=1298767 RepID=A0ABV8A6E6_9DEIO